jgi:hypothetical protein
MQNGREGREAGQQAWAMEAMDTRYKSAHVISVPMEPMKYIFTSI